MLGRKKIAAGVCGQPEKQNAARNKVSQRTATAQQSYSTPQRNTMHHNAPQHGMMQHKARFDNRLQ